MDRRRQEPDDHGSPTSQKTRRGGRGGSWLFVCLLLIVGHGILSVVILSGLDEQYRPVAKTINNPPLGGNSRLSPEDGWWLGRTDTSRGHPHMGARHPNGATHMLVDPSTARLASFDIATDANEALCPKNAAAGIEGEGGWAVLEKVKLGMQSAELASVRQNQKGATKGETQPRKSRILCMVYSVHLPRNKDGSNSKVAEHANLRAIAETWGKKCDGFIGASNFTDHSIGAVDLLHAGPEEYGNMWQKVRSMWAYAANYADQYDFYHVIGDDAYVAVDNLRSYLDGDEVARLEDGYLDEIARHQDFVNGSAEHEHIKPGHNDFRDGTSKWKDVRSRPLIFGLPIFLLREPLHADGSWNHDGIMFKMTYPAGGSGYTLNRAALKLLQAKGLNNPSTADRVDSREDVIVGGFFSTLGVTVSNTIDKRHGGRYLIASAEDAFRRKKLDPSPFEPVRMDRRFRLSHGDGLDGVSSGAISFHLKDDGDWLTRNGHSMADLIRRYHAVLYDLCPSLSNAALIIRHRARARAKKKAKIMQAQKV